MTCTDAKRFVISILLPHWIFFPLRLFSNTAFRFNLPFLNSFLSVVASDARISYGKLGGCTVASTVKPRFLEPIASDGDDTFCTREGGRGTSEGTGAFTTASLVCGEGQNSWTPPHIIMVANPQP